MTPGDDARALRAQLEAAQGELKSLPHKATRSAASRVASFCAVAFQVVALATWGTSRDISTLAGFGSLLAFWALIAAAVALGWPR